MKAAVFHGPRDIRCEDIEPPRLGADTLIIRVEAAAICNATDNRIYRAPRPEQAWPFLKPPYVLGHEACGTIVARGVSVDGCWQVGDRVAAWCMGHGAFAQFATLRPRELGALLRLDPRIDPDSAAMMELAAGTTRMLLDEAGGWRIRPGDRVVVVGLGPSGLLYLQEARCLGAGAVIGVGKHPFQMDFARSLGFADIHAYAEGGCVGRIRARHGPADVVIDTTGADIVAALADLLEPGGCFVPFGVPSYDMEPRVRLLESKGIRVARDAARCQQAMEAAHRWILDGSLNLKKLVTTRVDLEHIGDGLDACVAPDRRVVKVIVEIPQAEEL